MSDHSPKLCKNCLRPMPEELLAERKAKRCAAIKAGIANSNKKIGRPRVANYDLIRSLRLRGVSLSKIALQVGVSRGTVQHAVKGIKSLKGHTHGFE